MTNWGNSGPNTFVVLQEGTNIAEFTDKIAGFIKTKSEDTHRSLFLIKYSDNYLYGNFENGVQSGGRIEYVTLFSIIAIFILIIACINFMNLSTAKASRRIKEVGIKKAIGARRTTLIFQYLGESMFMTFLSLAVAILMVDLFLPQFNEITRKNLVLNFDINFLLSLLGIVLFTGLISGSYPALYLSGFNPATVLKGKLSTSFGELWARKGLVVFQFTLSVILIVYCQDILPELPSSFPAWVCLAWRPSLQKEGGKKLVSGKYWVQVSLASSTFYPATLPNLFLFLS